MSVASDISSAPTAWALPDAGAQVERQTRSSRIALSLAVAAVAVMFSMPWWADSGLMRSVIELSCYIVLAQMWNLLAGYAGLVSVGQQAFIGVSGYAMFVLANKFGVNPFLASVLCPVSYTHLTLPT